MQFKVKAARSGLGVLNLEIDASSIEEAKKQVLQSGYSVLAIQPIGSFIKLPKLFTSRFSLSLFSQELLALMDAGLPQVEALETILEKERRRTNIKLVRGIIDQLYEGKSLSKALESFPNEFNSLYVAMVKASEKTGNITDSLSRYIAYQAQIDVIRKKVVSSSVYPIVLIVAGLLVTMFLMLYVVPKFSQIYKDMGHNLPFFSQMFMNIGEFLGDNKVVVLMFLGALFFSGFYAAGNKRVRQKVLDQFKKIPNIGNRIHIYQLARFYRTFGMLLKGGVPVVPALEMVSGLLQEDLRIKLTKAKDGINEGKPVSASLDINGLTTPIATRLLRVGERTGKLDEMADRIANLYDDDMARWIDWFTKLFEPLLMCFIGLLIGLIVVSMYFPIFELAGSIQ
ncbi:MAG: type II secretion system F family protein [Methylophilaceae bacterium]|jgi:general secretion pathway protein F